MLDDASLERSHVVANARMNRERGLSGTNSYSKDLGLSPLEVVAPSGSWLDLCCGTGKALVEAALLAPGVTVVGVDLVAMFVALPPDLENLRLVEGSVARWEPGRRFDLVTCVHGLHYVGDKLGVLARAASWLEGDGRLVANLDLENVKVRGGARGAVARALRRGGFSYDARRRIVSRRGPGEVDFPFRYLGADDAAGPNFTGQPAVDSYYGA